MYKVADNERFDQNDDADQIYKQEINLKNIRVLTKNTAEFTNFH